MDDNKPKNGSEDDAYVIEDTGESVEQIEQEMEMAAHEAAGDDSSDAIPAAVPSGEPTLQDEVRRLNDRYLRTLADFENYRKRVDREKADFFRHALANTFRDLIPVLDNFDRALEHAEEGDDFHKGVLLIYKQLFDVLEKAGLRSIDQSGVPFDPNIHEAVVREDNPSVPSHTVVAILQKGYFLHDRLLRPAMVKVAVGGPEPADVVQ
jgi:molecular chaperone GrpE